QDLALPTPWDRQPQLAHGSARAGLAGGYADAMGGFAAIDWRLALHDLGDPARGYPELAQIEFLPTELRFYPRSQSVQLESFDLVKVISLHPMTLFDPALSWKMNAGAHRIRDDGGDPLARAGSQRPQGCECVGSDGPGLHLLLRLWESSPVPEIAGGWYGGRSPLYRRSAEGAEPHQKKNFFIFRERAPTSDYRN